MNIPDFSPSRRSSTGDSRRSLLGLFGIIFCLAFFSSNPLSGQGVQDVCGVDFDASFGCGTAVGFELFGEGAHDNIQTDVFITIDTALIDSMFVEVMVKAPQDSMFGNVTVYTSAGDTCDLAPVGIANLGSDEKAATYRTTVNPASVVTLLADPSDTAQLQSIVVFAVTRGLECSGSSAQLRGLLLYHACDTQTFVTNIVTTQDRSVRIRIPISELGDGLGGVFDRPAIIDFEFWDGGMIINSWRDSLNGPDDNISDYLTIYDTLVTGLPNTTDSLRMLFTSPGVFPIDPLACEFGDGDSYIVGTILVQASCDTGACCEIACTPPDTIFELCEFNIPPVLPEFLDSVGPRNMMGQNVDSLAWTDSLMATLTQQLCEYFIIYDSMNTDFLPGNVFINRFYSVYYDSAGMNVFSGSCQETFSLQSFGDLGLTCPPEDTVCRLEDSPVFADLDEFLAAGGEIMVVDTDLDSSSFTLISETTDGGSCPEVITRMYAISDSCLNADTCMQIIVVDDTEPPMLTCVGQTMVQCTGDIPAAYTTVEEFIAGGGNIVENCALDSASFMLTGTMTDGMTCPETIIRLYSVMDSCGNIGICPDTIVVNDTIPPVLFSCPFDVTVECSVDAPPAFTNWLPFLTAPGFSAAGDNCGGLDTTNYVPLVREESAGTCPEIITRTYQIVDSCGNAATCQQMITIDDMTPPTITCAGYPVFTQCDVADLVPYTTYAEFVAAGGSAGDNCGIDEMSFYLSSDKHMVGGYLPGRVSCGSYGYVG